MEEPESEIPEDVLNRLDVLLATDGFKQSSTAMFVKDMGADWRAWVAVTGFSFSVSPVVGVYNEDLVNIAKVARAEIGYPSPLGPDTGPPLIMANLQWLIGDDPDCRNHMSWKLEIKDHHKANPASVPELKPEAADDIVYCLRKVAYPFFAAHTTFQSIWDAVNNREANPSPALRNYFPMMLVKLGRRDDVPRYVDEQVKQMGNHEVVAKIYKDYVDAVLRLMPA